MIALYGELSTGYKDRDAPKKHYNDCLRSPIAACHVDRLCWSDMAAERNAWRQSIFKVVNKYEQDRRNAQEDKISKRKP